MRWQAVHVKGSGPEAILSPRAVAMWEGKTLVADACSLQSNGNGDAECSGNVADQLCLGVPDSAGEGVALLSASVTCADSRCMAPRHSSSCDFVLSSAASCAAQQITQP